MKYTCINAAYSDFKNKFMKEIDSIKKALIEKVSVTGNSKPRFDTETISAIRKETTYVVSWFKF